MRILSDCADIELWNDINLEKWILFRYKGFAFASSAHYKVLGNQVQKENQKEVKCRQKKISEKKIGGKI
jgi:hypothetical protein